jgi:hypothetical protein
MPFEVAINPNTLVVSGGASIREKQSTADYTEVPVVTTPGGNVATNRHIQRDQPWFVRYNFSTSGIFTAFLKNGTWRAKVVLEEMGGGESGYMPLASAVDTGAGSYTIDVNVSPPALNAGLYRVVAQLRWHFSDGSAGPILAFEDLGIINIYED